MSRRISLRQIDAFNAFMSTGTVGAAAQSLYISQPALSKLLSNFETDVGVQLFIRKSGRLFPTRQAYRIHSEIDRVFAGLMQIETAIERIRRDEYERIAIGIMPALSGEFAARVITEFGSLHPHIHVSLIARHSSYIVDQVASRNIDVGLVNWATTGPNIITLPFMKRDLVCIMPAKHHLAGQHCVELKQLQEENFVAFHKSNNTSKAIHDLLQDHNVQPTIVAEASTSLTICTLVASGIGVSIIHPIHLQEPSDRVVMRPLHPTTSLNLIICHRNDPSDFNKTISSFIDVILAE